MSKIAIDYDTNSQYTKQPNHDRIAFSTTVFDQGYELYLADGVSSVEDVPSNVYQITSDTKIGVSDITWKHGNRLRFWRDATLYELKLPQSNKAFNAEPIQERAVPGSVENMGGED